MEKSGSGAVTGGGSFLQSERKDLRRGSGAKIPLRKVQTKKDIKTHVAGHNRESGITGPRRVQA